MIHGEAPSRHHRRRVVDVGSHLPNLAKHRDEVEFIIINRRNPDLLSKIQTDFGLREGDHGLA